MTPANQLKEEHEGILLMLKILEKICARLEAKEKVEIDPLERIIEFIRVFADKCHHGKEEDLLFPELERAGIPKDHGPIGVMLVEHDQGRAYVKGMGEAIAGFKKGDPQVGIDFVKNARSYISLLTQHIQKENNVLFPMGDKVLSKEKQQNLLKAFDKLESERIGVGMHESFHNLLNHLQEVYLK